MSRSRLLIFAGVIAAIALAGGGFIAGMNVGTANASNAAANASRGSTQARQGQGPGQGQPGQFAGGAQGRAVNGQVLSVGDGTITVQLGQDQGSRIVLVAPSTRIARTTETDIQLSNLKPGERITVVGQENSDGTVSAQAVIVGGNALQQLFGTPRPSPTR